MFVCDWQQQDRASARGTHPSDQAGGLPNKQTKSTERDASPRLQRRRCDRRKRQRLTLPDSRLLSAQTWRTHDHTPDHVCQRRRCCRLERQNRGWVGGWVVGVDLTVQSCCSPQMTACFQGWVRGGGGHSQSPFTYHVYDSIVEVNYGHYGPQGQNPIT